MTKEEKKPKTLIFGLDVKEDASGLSKQAPPSSPPAKKDNNKKKKETAVFFGD